MAEKHSTGYTLQESERRIRQRDESLTRHENKHPGELPKHLRPGYSHAEQRRCLEAVDPNTLTSQRRRVLAAYLRKDATLCKSRLLPAAGDVAREVGISPTATRREFAWLCTEGALRLSPGPGKVRAEAERLGIPRDEIPDPYRRAAKPQEAEARLIGRAILDAGFPTGTTLDNLEPAEKDAVFVVVFRLAAEPGLRVCPGCNTPMLSKRTDTDKLGFGPRQEICSAACRQRVSRAANGTE